MTFFEIAAYVLALVIVLILCRIFIKPLRKVGAMVLWSGLGGVGLWIFNLVGGMFGFTLGINAATASVCGLLGLPGLIMLAAVKFIYVL